MSPKRRTARAERITISLGGVVWEYVDHYVAARTDQGLVYVYDPDTKKLITTAPLNAAVIEWIGVEVPADRRRLVAAGD